ncbi:MAG TPA: histidine phosphatase family protein [Methylomirabilota bacterium]|nr:histidine phosphatase family protein [Methylomirabilota bacterium]
MSLFGGSLGCAAVDVHSKPGTTTTVILTRHADRDGESDELNPKGLERAKALVDAVSGMGVTAIYSPDVERNLASVRPLASRLGIEITRTPKVSVFAAGSIVNEILEKHAGGVVVWVGNVSGNLQAMYRLLGGTGTAPIEYGDLHILTIPDQGPVKVVKKRYGP